MPLHGFAELFAQRFPHLIGRPILVALSGGPDSVALLHLLRDPTLELTLEAAHVHHGVRGVEADEDADFCRQLCSGLHIPFHLVRLEQVSGSRGGREAAWRRGRYRTLLSIKVDADLAAVATGHHRDDVAEGVLMQLLRGAGPRGMAGIASETPEGVVRPLLDWSRAQLVEWLTDRGYQWREDSSNLDLGHLRNLVRHVILPDLRTASPAIDDHLVTLAEALAADEAFFAKELRTADLWIDPWMGDGGVQLEAIESLDRPLRSRWLHAQAARIGLTRVTRGQLGLFHRLVETGEPRAVTLASRWRLRLARHRLWLEPPDPPSPYILELEPGSTIDLPLPGWKVRARHDQSPDASATWHALLPTDAKFTVRSAASDDTVAGAEGTIRVSKLLSKHLPRHLRRAWPLFCESDTILWIPGVWQGSVTGNLLVEVLIHGGAARSLHG